MLEKKFADFLSAQELEEKKILISVSGGVDSMVLLAVAAKVCPKNIAVFHLHHGTRGKEATKDADLVASFCLKHEIPFYGEWLQEKAPKNRENFWRQHRLELGQKCAQDFGAERILTAHHATDLVETMIFRLTKGCGLDGLAPFDISTKPFWDIPKRVLIDYAEANNIEWREDESNTDESLQRNLIRHKVLPELRKITPNLEKVFVAESQLFQKSADFLYTYCQEKLSSKTNLPLADFLTFPEIIQQTLLRLISGETPSLSEIEDTRKWLLNNPKSTSKKQIGARKLWIQNKALHWK